MPDPEPAHLLILGGTAEAADLAAAATARFGAALRITYSLAGRTRTPAPVAGASRVGGFGGADGLAAWLRSNRVNLVVDATHPYAREISAHARQACEAADIPRLVLARPSWRAAPGDDWRCVPDLDTAAAVLPDIAQRAFLSIGSMRLGAFAGLRTVHLVVRTVDPPRETLPLADYSVVLGRGPFDVAAERCLLRRERIGAVVSRNSGGRSTYAKIEAARSLELPVVMISPPPREAGAIRESVEGVLEWIAERKTYWRP